MAEPISARDRVAWDRIRYASVWEDADVLCDALAPVAAGGRLLSIASAGDNALALLTLEPDEVVAVDLNPAQLACLELRVAAFRCLDDAVLLPFLGIGEGPPRLSLYARVRDRLGPEARAYWDSSPELIERGVIHVGKFERYLRTFRHWVLPMVHPESRLERLVDHRSIAEQRRFFAREWNTTRWRLLFRVFFSRKVMGKLGRDPALFDHVAGEGAEAILERTRYALNELPTATNPYLVYIMTGSFRPDALPRYLRPEHRETIRAHLDRLSWRRQPIEAAEGPFDGFNLSDVFEYLAPEEHERVYGELVARARPGARLVYWNMLAPRRRPPEMEGRVQELDELSRELHSRDRAWFYQALRVDEVVA